MFVIHRFKLNDKTKNIINGMTPKFGYDGFGELVFYRTYSRQKPDNQGQENWNDVVIRVTEGTFSIRKDWYIKNHLVWDEEYWQNYAQLFSMSMFNMYWLPPGRGLWAMGTDFVYERGSMAVYNCAFCELGRFFSSDIAWLMDALMHGVGVGFNPIRDNALELYEPKDSYNYVIPDTREGWTESVKALINSYLYPFCKKPKFDYSKLRPAGSLIKGFGGIASGPDPLKWYHDKIDEWCHYYLGDMEDYDSVMLKTDLANGAGYVVCSGNLRRSAEIAIGSIKDKIFIDLKDFQKYPYREDVAFISNNSVILENDEDFDLLGEIAKRVIKNGEPGYINRRNFKYARIGKKMKGLRKDIATGINPCAEIILEDKCLCNISETLPTVCPDTETWLKACEYATFYCSTVSLLPTHQPETNKVIARNRRIGISIIDFTGWKQERGTYKVISFMRQGYDLIRKINKQLANDAGVPPSIRVTTVKPGGSVPKLAGRTPGISYPSFIHTLRRIRVQRNTAFHKLLVKANIPYEKDFYSQNTDVFSYPIIQGPAKPVEQITLWEQAMNLVLMQREWADNAVSNTLLFKPKWKLIRHLKITDENDGVLFNFVSGYKFNLENLIEEKAIEAENDEYKIKLIFKNDSLKEIKFWEYDSKHEENDIEPVLSAIAPLTKSVSLLPHTPKGVYVQMPEEGITVEEYNDLKSQIKTIDWSKFSGSDGIDEKYCTSDKCEIPITQE